MKTFHSWRTLSALALLLQFGWPPAAALAQTTAFTYQGQLVASNAPANGVFDLTFTLFRAATGNTTVGTSNVVNDLGVTNGLFTTQLDFLLESFETGEDRWLEIAVRPGASTGGYTTLLPRQPITPAPLSIFAARAGGADSAAALTGSLPAAQISGVLASGNLAGTYTGAVTLSNPANSLTGNGSGLTGLNASQLASGTVPDARLAANVARTNQVWLLGGNTGANGAFLGTTDTNALEFRVNGQRVLRFGEANIVAGYPDNGVSNGVSGAVISGGGGLFFPNRAGGNFATVVGGAGNTASGAISTAMGYSTTASGYASTAMGYYNTASGTYSTAMGAGTSASSNYSTAMGYNSTASGFASTAMGNETTASGAYSTAMGAATMASGDLSTAMGNLSEALGDYSTAMGFDTRASGTSSTAMGSESTASGTFSTAMGQFSVASGTSSTAMGFNTRASGDVSMAMGASSLAQHHNTFVWADNGAPGFASTGTNQFLIRASGGVGIGTANPNAPLHVTGGTDAGLTGGGHLVLGNLNAGNLVLDGNEIMARDFGAASYLVLNNNGGGVGIGRIPTANALEVSGTASKSAAGSWLANSDARIKRDITPVTDALATLDKVRLVSFDYTEGYRTEHPEVESRRHLNVIAQEFREVFPEHVKSSGEKLPDGSEILQVDTYPLTIYSAAAVQELNRKLKSLEAQNAALLRRLDAMEARMK